MRFVPRLIAPELQRAAHAFPALLVTGPRRAGKTTLLRKLFPRASYWLLEDPDVIARVRSDPRGFLDDLELPTILDEIQNVPELLRYVRTRIDAAPSRKGRWLLTGSQESELMRGVTESMAGRAAVFHLMPLARRESAKVSLLKGGFPEVIARPRSAATWFRSYVQTYLERDVRLITNIRDLVTFRRFIALVASRTGQILNKTDLAAPLGVSVPTITEWMDILEVTGQILLVPPFFENFGKRLIKSPKLYFADSGLACHLLGIDDEKALRGSPFRGPVFEGFVAAELIKEQINAGHAKALYFFRDQQGLEVDFVVPRGARKLWLVEAKTSKTLMPDDAASIGRLSSSIRGYDLKGFVVGLEGPPPAGKAPLCPGVHAVGIDQLVASTAR